MGQHGVKIHLIRPAEIGGDLLRIASFFLSQGPPPVRGLPIGTMLALLGTQANEREFFSVLQHRDRIQTGFRLEYALSEVSLVTVTHVRSLDKTVYCPRRQWWWFLSNLRCLSVHAEVCPSKMCQGLAQRPLKCNTQCTGGTEDDFVIYRRILCILKVRYFALDQKSVIDIWIRGSQAYC